MNKIRSLGFSSHNKFQYVDDEIDTSLIDFARRTMQTAPLHYPYPSAIDIAAMLWLLDKQ